MRCTSARSSPLVRFSLSNEMTSGRDCGQLQRRSSSHSRQREMQKSQKSWRRRAKDVPKSPPSTKAHCTDQSHPVRPATRPGQLRLKILSCDRTAQGAHEDRDSRRSERREATVGLRQGFGLLYAVLPRRHRRHRRPRHRHVHLRHHPLHRRHLHRLRLCHLH